MNSFKIAIILDKASEKKTTKNKNYCKSCINKQNEHCTVWCKNTPDTESLWVTLEYESSSEIKPKNLLHSRILYHITYTAQLSTSTEWICYSGKAFRDIVGMLPSSNLFRLRASLALCPLDLSWANFNHFFIASWTSTSVACAVRRFFQTAPVWKINR